MATDAFDSVSRAYERGRLRWAISSAMPALVVAAIACALSTRLPTTLGLSLLLFSLVAALLFVGRGPGRGAYTGLVAGVIPLGLALAAQAYGHVCAGGECVSLCLPACVAGGLIAGFVVARQALRSPAPRTTLAAAAAVAGLTGAMGCACVGYSGVLGLGVGLLTSIAATRLADSMRAA